MKTNFQFNLFFSGLILVIFITVNSFAQINWEKDASNPVLAGVSGNWDQEVWHPVVIYEDEIFKMWFLAYYSGNYQVGYAESYDGLTWGEMLLVIPSGQPEEWDRYKAPHTIVRINDTLKMWYHGSTNWADNFSIGYAWSVIEHEWNFLPEPVMVKGETGSWDDTYVYNPSVYYDGEQYQMWYTGSADGWYDEIGYATSVNGIDWEKDYINSPVIELGDPGSFYDEWVQSGPVIKQNGICQMWFTGLDGYYMKVGFATSANGVDWTIENNMEPVVDVGLPGSWDDEVIHQPSVLIQGECYKMWYGGGGTLYKIGYAGGDSPVIRVPSQYPTIQAGIDAACNGNMVLVDTGMYYENINFMGKAITVASKYIQDGDTNHIYNTIIDGGQPANPNNGSVVYCISGEDTTSVLCGFTIQNGTGTYPDQWNTRSGGGIYCVNSGAKIIHNIIKDNLVDFSGGASGGGIMVASSGGNLETAVIRHNTISNNSVTNASWTIEAGGGGIFLWLTNVLMQYNVIANNTAVGWAYGGGLYHGYSAGIISHNHFESNNANITHPNGLGGGLFIFNPHLGLHVTQNAIISNTCTGGTNRGGGIGVINWEPISDYYIDGNIIAENEANRGGGICFSVSEPGCFITNNVIVDNKADEYGGGISIYSSSEDNIKQKLNGRGVNSLNLFGPAKDGLMPKIINNTILYNESVSMGGGIANGLDGTDVLAFNNIIYENDASLGEAVYTQLTTSTAHLYNNDIDTSLIYGLWTGLNNIFEDPEFDQDGYHLSPGSPCKEAGINSVTIVGQDYFCPEFDIDGDLRPFNTLADIGADELQLIVRTTESNLVNNTLVLQNSPNPFTGETTIKFVLNSESFIDLCLFDLSGKKIKVILNENLPAGNHEINWDASRLKNGMYFCTLKTNDGVQTKKIIKL
jgi:hypothetical protein